MYEATSRALKKVPLHIPLPLYARNVGRHDKAQECNGAVSALLSDYIGMTFCIKGAGKAFLFQESFSMHEGDVSKMCGSDAMSPLQRSEVVRFEV